MQPKINNQVKIKLDIADPIPAPDIQAFLNGASGFYRELIREKWPQDQDKMKGGLVITRINPGCIEFWFGAVIPYAGQLLQLMDDGLIIKQYYELLTGTLERFISPEPPKLDAVAEALPEIVHEIFQPVADAAKAGVEVSEVEFDAQNDDWKISARVKYNRQQIRRARKNAELLISDARQRRRSVQIPVNTITDTRVAGPSNSTLEKGVVIQFDSVNSRRGKTRGRPKVDTAVVPVLSPSALKVDFRTHQLRTELVQGDLNPHKHGFVVDLYAQREDGELKSYFVLELHGPALEPDDMFSKKG